MVGSKRLTSPEWVTTGVRPDSRVASAKADLLGRVLRPGVSVGTVSVIFSDFLTITESAKSSYLNDNYSWVKFQPSIQPGALTEQLKLIGSDKLNLYTTYELVMPKSLDTNSQLKTSYQATSKLSSGYKH